MIPALVEGYLDGRVLATIWRQLGNTDRALLVRNAGGSPFWDHAKRYNEAARRQTTVGLADLEQSPCASEALLKLGKVLNAGFKLRLAVRMVESWLLADREAFADYLGVQLVKMPRDPDLLQHPKRTVIELARQSRRRTIREGVVPSGSAMVGAEYTPVMAAFVERQWESNRARAASPSLERACLRWAGI